ncbi:hypothetical protein CcI6DRAFT_04148 [Frankia sp. CcI6]|nr:hypothetical protein CcI6DRAFT_04148 [Frankia sp. CcI6]
MAWARAYARAPDPPLLLRTKARRNAAAGRREDWCSARRLVPVCDANTATRKSAMYGTPAARPWHRVQGHVKVSHGSRHTQILCPLRPGYPRQARRWQVRVGLSGERSALALVMGLSTGVPSARSSAAHRRARRTSAASRSVPRLVQPTLATGGLRRTSRMVYAVRGATGPASTAARPRAAGRAARPAPRLISKRRIRQMRGLVLVGTGPPLALSVPVNR